jgi:hypothetical protein
MINEKFIQFVWQHKLFDTSRLQTVQGEAIQIIKQGSLNTFDGPDFSDANIKIGNLEWFGTVEIHIKDFDWYKHGHQNDAKYRNVILHVVWDLNDEEAVPKDIPCLILEKYVSSSVRDKYENLVKSKESMPCKPYLANVSNAEKSFTLQEMAQKRLARKSEVLIGKLKELSGDWHSMLFYLFAMALGKKANREAMQEFAQHLDFKLLLKHRDNSISIEAMVFGVAGLLDEDSEDDYLQKLKKEFEFLKAKYSLKIINKDLWNFAKVRGSSKPHLSLAMLTALVDFVFKMDNIKQLRVDFFENLKLTSYWQDHYRFGQKSKTSNRISKDLIHHFQINVVVPYLVLLGKYYSDYSYQIQAQNLLKTLPKEQNSIVSKFLELDFLVENSFDSQGTIELNNEYCNHKMCLDCHIGRELLK